MVVMLPVWGGGTEMSTPLITVGLKPVMVAYLLLFTENSGPITHYRPSANEDIMIL